MFQHPVSSCSRVEAEAQPFCRRVLVLVLSRRVLQHREVRCRGLVADVLGTMMRQPGRSNSNVSDLFALARAPLLACIASNMERPDPLVAVAPLNAEEPIATPAQSPPLQMRCIECMAVPSECTCTSSR